MRRILCVLALVVVAGSAAAGRRHVTDQLEQDVARGEISNDDAALYAALAMVDARLLPERYAGAVSEDCGMRLLSILHQTLPEASVEARDAVRYVMAPHERAQLRRPSLVPESLASVPWNVVSSARFRVYYEHTGEQPFALQYVGLFEQAYTDLAALGFTMPAPPIDVLLVDNPCIADIGIPCVAGISLPPAFAGRYGGTSDVPLILLRKSLAPSLRLAAHELFHQVQYATAGGTTMLFLQFVLEGQASAMENVLYPVLQNNSTHFAKYDETIEFSLNHRLYDAAIFWRYLIRKQGPGAIHRYLGEIGRGVDDIDALRNVAGDLSMAMREFALWTFYVGTRHDPMYFGGDAAHWELTNFINHSLGKETEVPFAPNPIAGLSARYVRITPDDTVTEDLKLTIKARSGGAGMWAWVVNRRTSGSDDYNVLPLTGEEYVIEDFNFADTAEVVLIFSNGDEAPSSFEYELKLPLRLDLAFCMDTTGSMYNSIAALVLTASGTREILERKEADFRIAITEFKDHPFSPYGWAGDYPYKAKSRFSKDPNVIDGGIGALEAWGGGDWPEAHLFGMMSAINAVDIEPWRRGVKKAIVVMTDAPPHDPDLGSGLTSAIVAAAAEAGGVVQYPGFARFASQSTSAETPIAIYGVIVGSDFQAYSKMAALAAATAGQVWVTSYNTHDIAATLLAAIDTIGGADEPPPTSNRPPAVSAALAEPGQLWPPNNKLVPVRITNVTDPDGDTVTIEITAITQDEPVGKDADADGVGTANPRVRSERDGGGNGRVYAIAFKATDARGASSNGSVTVCVPHDQGGNTVCTDDGQSYASTH